MSKPTKATLLERLEAHGITDLDPKDHTVQKLQDMLAFVEDQDDDDDGAAAMGSAVELDVPDGADAHDELETDGLEADVQLAPPEPMDLDDLTDDMPDDVADRVAELFGDIWEDGNDPDDLGQGHDEPAPYVETVANYHLDTLKALDRETGEPLGLDRIVRGQMRETIERARALGRRITHYPVVAHNYPQTGNRRQIVVQVRVARTRTARQDRRTARGDRL